MVNKVKTGAILALIGSILTLFAGFLVFSTIAMTEMEIQALIAQYKSSFPTLNVTIDYTLLYVKAAFIVVTGIVGIVGAILILKEIKAGAFICIILGFFILISAFIPIGYVTTTITGLPGYTSLEPILATLGGTFIYIDPIMTSIGGIVGYLGLKE
ncbi:MAG: hypothetical protein EAX96_15680 [Candidatus Lokiarchaeota archaeon]|nr:hypothetical protein [Candidatus Lokiarchaeota archaeon]